MTTTVEKIAAEAAAPANRLRVCLAASGGGHLRQLLDLQSVWEKHRYFFVTEDTALGRTIAQDHPTHFLPHFAWGQAKQGALLRMLGEAVVSFCKSASIILRERPDVLITTGAGAVYPAVLWARVMGTKVIAMESFARFEQPSLFGRLAAPISHHFIIPSAGVSRWYPNAEVFDPLVILETPTPPKEDLIFATVGATLPFDRMVASVAQLKNEGAISERVVIQTGVGGLVPEGLEVHETLPFGQIESLLKKATVVICHGGTGSIITALREGCHVIAVPRLSELEEHYDDHQSEITDAFERRGLIMVARSTEELRDALAHVHGRSRIVATTDPVELSDYMDGLLADYAVAAAKRA